VNVELINQRIRFRLFVFTSIRADGKLDALKCMSKCMERIYTNGRSLSVDYQDLELGHRWIASCVCRRVTESDQVHYSQIWSWSHVWYSLQNQLFSIIVSLAHDWVFVSSHNYSHRNFGWSKVQGQDRFIVDINSLLFHIRSSKIHAAGRCWRRLAVSSLFCSITHVSSSSRCSAYMPHCVRLRTEYWIGWVLGVVRWNCILRVCGG